LIAAALAVLATTIGQAAGLFDTPPTPEQMEHDARARGIEGTLHVITPVPDHSLAPERHGPYLFVPLGWHGDLEPFGPVGTPGAGGEASNDTGAVESSAIWRNARVPVGLHLDHAWSESLSRDARSEFVDRDGHPVVSTTVRLPQIRPIRVDVWTDGGTRLFEYTEIDGHPAVTWRTPADAKGEIGVRLFHEQSGIEYAVQLSDTRTLTLPDAIEILRSMLDAKN